jgi:FkbM family methyltransferase
VITNLGKIRKKTFSWLLAEPFAYAIPSIRLLDKITSFVTRIFYIAIRILLRIFLGKDKRENLKFYHDLSRNANVSLSFYFFVFIHTISKFLGVGNLPLVKIIVPKYNYKVLCPATIDDYNNMTGREEEILEHFNPKMGETIIDVGAHHGRYTLISANRVGKSGKVISIEANPIVFEKLKKNIELNELTNTESLNYAVYSDKTRIKLFFPKEGLKNTIYNTIVSGRITSEEFIEVNADTLDNILSYAGIKFDNVKWIKIDVEGAELEVLKGAHNILSKSKDIAILIEVHNIAEGRNLYENIMDLLKPYNFKIEFEKIHESGERHIIVRKKQQL